MAASLRNSLAWESHKRVPQTVGNERPLRRARAAYLITPPLVVIKVFLSSHRVGSKGLWYAHYQMRWSGGWKSTGVPSS